MAISTTAFITKADKQLLYSLHIDKTHHRKPNKHQRWCQSPYTPPCVPHTFTLHWFDFQLDFQDTAYTALR